MLNREGNKRFSHSSYTFFQLRSTRATFFASEIWCVSLSRLFFSLSFTVFYSCNSSFSSRIVMLYVSMQLRLSLNIAYNNLMWQLTIQLFTICCTSNFLFSFVFCLCRSYADNSTRYCVSSGYTCGLCIGLHQIQTSEKAERWNS